MSRPRPSALGHFGVATWSFEVATSGRPSGRVATNARPACARPTHVERATWLGRVRAVHAHICTQPALVQCTVLCTVQVTVWITVHRD